TGVAERVLAPEVSNVLGRIAVDQVPAPHLRLQGTARVRDENAPWEADMERAVGEDVSTAAEDPHGWGGRRPLAPLLFDLPEVLRQPGVLKRRERIEV